MSESDYTKLQLVGRHLEEPWDGVGPNPHDTPNPVTGFYEIGALIDGAFVPIYREKASRVLELVANAKAAQASAPAASE